MPLLPRVLTSSSMYETYIIHKHHKKKKKKITTVEQNENFLANTEYGFREQTMSNYAVEQKDQQHWPVMS